MSEMERLAERLVRETTKMCEVSMKLLERERGLMTFSAELLEDGRVTVPKAVRDKLGLNKGDLLELRILRVILPAER